MTGNVTKQLNTQSNQTGQFSETAANALTSQLKQKFGAFETGNQTHSKRINDQITSFMKQSKQRRPNACLNIQSANKLPTVFKQIDTNTNKLPKQMRRYRPLGMGLIRFSTE